jgi:hypothetical protein
MEAAPQAIEAPKVPSEESRDVSHQTADVLEVVATAQDPAPSATSSGAMVQGNSGTIQSQTVGPPPSTQL